MSKIKITLDYGDSRYGIVNVQVPEHLRAGIQKHLQHKYRKQFSHELDPKNKDDFVIALMATLMGGIRKILLQTIYEAHGPLNILELATLVRRPYSYVHRDVNVLKDLGTVKIENNGKARDVVLQAEIEPYSKRLQHKIEHPTREIAAWKKDLTKMRKEEEEFRNRVQDDLNKLTSNALDYYLTKASLRR